MSDSSGSDWEAAEDETLAELEAEQVKYAAELEELRSAQRTSAGLGSDTPNLWAENEKLRAELAAMASVSASASKRRDEEDVKAKLAQLSAENVKVTAALESDVGLSELTGVRSSASVLAASRARMAGLGKGIADSAVRASKMRSALQEQETREKGVALQIPGGGLLGGNRSAKLLLPWHISEAVTRVACVIYRDIDDGPKLTEVSDFVTKQGLDAMTSFLSGVHATGGADECESIASGLKAALKLSWRSSTKLLIPFGDAPAHGTMYHNGQSGDIHPGGDPTGLVPEKLVKQLCSNRVNYYFAQINTTTIDMTNMFAEYRHSQNAVFKVLDRGATASNFIPMVVDSVRDSMRRSAFFASGKTVSSSGRGDGKGDPKTIFHSVL
ncbi:TPA: hypothetical protein ACH3X1_010166 [Trebouxia sp. C0004]